MKKLLFLFSIAIIFFAASCNKEPTITIGDDDDCNIDPVVLTDDMFFGCKINGQPWKFQNFNSLDALLNPTINIGYQPNNNHWFFISGKRQLETPCEPANQSLSIDIINPKLGDNIISFDNRMYIDYNDDCSQYYLDTLSKRVLNLSMFDTINKRASGTFCFQALVEDCTDTIKVTDGRFNVTWQ